MISDMNDKQKALEWILSRMAQTKNNEQFLELMRNE
jgi:transcription termination factor Rho